MEKGNFIGSLKIRARGEKVLRDLDQNMTDMGVYIHSDIKST